MYDWIMKCGFNGIVVATKADKLSKNQIAKGVSTIKKELGMKKGQVVIPISSANRYGKYDVWDVFNELFEVNQLDIKMERQVSEGGE